MRLRPAGTLFVAAAAVTAAGCCTAELASRRWIGHRPPKDTSDAGVVCRLSPVQQSPVRGLAAGIAFLTTPFKRLGVFGWTALRDHACGEGEVVGVKESTDGFVTIDLRLQSLELDGLAQELPASPQFLRVEWCRRGQRLPPIRKGGVLHVCGRLMWDSDGPDGFFEIHPFCERLSP